MGPNDLELLREILQTELPRLLREHPEARHELWGIMLEAFPSRQEFNALLEELRAFRRDTDQRFAAVDQRFEELTTEMRQGVQEFHAFREETNQRFEAVDQRFVAVDQRFDELTTEMRQGFQNLHKAIDRLGARWGIRNESLFRQTIATLLEESFGVKVESRLIDGEQFDVIISNGQCMLVEISASVGPTIQERLERTRRVFTQATGMAPVRVILATASIHSQRAQALRAAGFEVIEPEEEALEEIP